MSTIRMGMTGYMHCSKKEQHYLKVRAVGKEFLRAVLLIKNTRKARLLARREDSLLS